ncbi:MAG: flagellar basal body-associated FliL family protein [Actinomycetota bacterium]|nr:flagellar basal body-associated FliL family protein [Actinomycetota bacterium]
MAKKEKEKTDESEEEEGGKGGGGGSKVQILISVGLVLVGALIYRFLLAPPAPTMQPTTPQTIIVTTTMPVEGEVVALPELVLNLADDDPTRYLRVNLALVLAEGIDPVLFESKLAIASDIAIGYFSDKTYAELREPGAKEMVKEELGELVRAAYEAEDPQPVVRVLLTSFLMQ